MFIQGELEHRHVKSLFSRTNKNNYTVQIAAKTRRSALLRKIRARDRSFTPRRDKIRQAQDAKVARATAAERARKLSAASPDRRESEELDLGDPADRFDAGKSRNKKIYIYNWLDDNKHDPAIEVSDSRCDEIAILFNVSISRTSSLCSTIICSDGYSVPADLQKTGNTPNGPTHSTKKNTTACRSSTISYSSTKLYGSTTRRTTSGAIKTL